MAREKQQLKGEMEILQEEKAKLQGEKDPGGGEGHVAGCGGKL